MRTSKFSVRAFGTVFAALRDLGDVRQRHFIAIGVSALIGGIVDAALIFLVIRLALVMSAGQDAFSFNRGPIDARLSVPGGFALAAILLLVSFSASWATARSAARVATDAVEHARRLTMATFLDTKWEVQAKERPSRLQELLSGHVARLGNSAIFVSNGLVAMINFTAFLVSAILITPLAALVMGVGLVLFAVGLIPLTRLTRRRAAEQAVRNRVYADAVSQVVSLAREARVFNVGFEIRDDVARLSSETARVSFSMRFLARITPVVYQLVALSLLVGGLAAAYAASLGDVSSLGAMVVLLVRAISYGQQINTSVQQCSEQAPYLTELKDQITLYQQHAVRLGGEDAPVIERLAVQDVVLSYAPGPPVLRGLTFEVVKGETIGIVGPSGSGKSTLVQLLLGLREPESGSLMINGRDARLFSQDSWFRQVALVPQDNHLLPGTVLDNIRFFRKELDEKAVVRAARLAHLHDEIVALPDGYLTEVGPGARDLSGGQKQRLGLARALCARPSLLVLDEPTSALDMHSEALIQTTLADLKSITTCFIVAHRLSTLASCDRVMVLEEGRISAFGRASEVQDINRFFRKAVDLSRGGLS